jgi:hypothetical protein
MMRPSTIRIIALVLVLMVCAVAAAGWDPVFNDQVMTHLSPRMDVCF